MGSKKQDWEHVEARIAKFINCVLQAEIKWANRVRWLREGSKKEKHLPVLTLRRYDKLTHLMGSVTEPPRGDPDRARKDWEGTRLGALIKGKVSGEDPDQNKEVRKRMWLLCGNLSSVRLAHKAGETEDMIDCLLFETQERLISLEAYLDKIR